MFPFTDQFWRALADYQIKFADAGSLGSGTPPVNWLEEYNRVRATAMSSVLITSGSFEGGGNSGVQNFPQEILLDALHCRRFDLDANYELPVHLLQYPSAKISCAKGNGGFVISFQ